MTEEEQFILRMAVKAYAAYLRGEKWKYETGVTLASFVREVRDALKGEE